MRVTEHVTEFAVATDRERLHRDVSSWLCTVAGTRFGLALRTADLVVADLLADPRAHVFYLTAGQIVRYRDAALGEYVRTP